MDVVETFVSYLRSCYAGQSVRLVSLHAANATNLATLGQDAAATVVTGPAALERLLMNGITPSFVGWCPQGERVAIVEHARTPARFLTPPDFRVIAIVPTFNEADVIAATLRYLIAEGVEVYVIDNWSTDATWDIVRDMGSEVLGCERFPLQRPPTTYNLRDILGRVEDVAANLRSDWVILHDADERRRSPWPGVGLRDALARVDQSGFNCVDHVTLNFWPIDNGYEHTTVDLEEYFPYFEFSNHPGHFHQRRAWKNVRERVALAQTAGHDVHFQDRRVYPYKFLLKHYPVRSQAHGERKVLRDRAARWNPAERSLGWHAQYDGVRQYIRPAAELERFDGQTFYERRLIERLSGLGVFAAPPSWATPPIWSTDQAA